MDEPRVNADTLALMDDLQRRNVLPLSCLPEAETILSFLDDMELLEFAELECKPTRKKKLSSTERRSRDRVLLRGNVADLQLQLETIKTAKRLAKHKFWKRHRELYGSEPWLLDNLNLQRRLARENNRAEQAAILLRHMGTQMKHLTYSEANVRLQTDAGQDAAIFERLQHRISENQAKLAQKWKSGGIPVATCDGMDTFVGSDGTSMSCQSARFLPFEVKTIGDTVWRVAQTGFQSGSYKTVFHRDSDTVAMKEQLTIHPAGHSDVALCVRVFIKRIVLERRAIFFWETFCEWATPSSTQTSKTEESGWMVIQPIETGSSSSSLSVVQSFMKMTMVKSSTIWAELMRTSGVTVPMIVPASLKVMLSRMQHVENSLLDAGHGSS